MRGDESDYDAPGVIEHGNICGINKERGYGFIIAIDDKRQIYFHHSAIIGGREIADLRLGDQVEYKRINHAKGPRALDVRFIDGEPRSVTSGRG